MSSPSAVEAYSLGRTLSIGMHDQYLSGLRDTLVSDGIDLSNIDQMRAFAGGVRAVLSALGTNKACFFLGIMDRGLGR